VRIEAEQKKKKYALIAHQVYLKNNKIKVELSLARSKNHRDKRNDIKNKENDRYAKKVIKNFK
jgi:tmRNA-binding protein